MRIELSIIIVSYNVRELLEGCLRSVFAQEGCAFEVFVVDNASSDGSAEMVRENFPQVKLTASRENLGFAAANNAVLDKVGGELVYYLNPDTVLPERDVLAGIRDFMKTNQRVGMASTRLVFGDGSDQPAVKYKYDGQKYSGGLLSGLPGEMAWVIGASMVTRRELMMQTGGFDERFFIYGEDEDLCLSVRKLGYEVGFIGEVTVIHYQGQSEKRTPAPELVRKKLAGSRIFYEKHYTPEVALRICAARCRRARLKMLRLRCNPLNLLRQSERTREKQQRCLLELEVFG
jgi:hypothetical protein